MASFEILGSDYDETRVVRAPELGYSLALAGHPRVFDGEPDGAKYDIRIALADVPVEHGLRISEMPDQMNPQALAISLATAYRNTRATSPDDGTVEALPDAGAFEAGAHVLYTRKGVDPAQTEYVWVAIHRVPTKYLVLYHTVRFRTADLTMFAWGHLRGSFVDQHVWSEAPRAAPTIWPASAITQPSAKLDLTDKAWDEARAKAVELEHVPIANALDLVALLRDEGLAYTSPNAAVGEAPARLRERITSAAPAIAHVLLRGLDECRTHHDLRGWIWQSAWLLSAKAARDTGFRARFAFGNPFKPFGMGAYTVTIGLDDQIELVHERGGQRRRWIARAEPAVVPTLEAGLASASFPAPPSVKVGRPGASGFEIVVPRADGTIERTSGFPSPNYRDVSTMFSHIVSQMSGDAVLGIVLPVETQYISDPKEIDR